MTAIDKNDLVAAKAALLADPGSINKGRGPYSMPPLYRALGRGNLEMVQLLLENGADPNRETSQGTPLFVVLSSYFFDKNWKSISEFLIQKGLKVDNADSKGNTSLMSYLTYGGGNNRQERVQFLLERGASVTLRNHKGRSALDLAFVFGTGSGPNLILEKADIKVRDRDGNTVLHTIVNGDHSLKLKPLQQALSRGSEVNAKNGAGDTPLHLVASQSGEGLRTLLDAGADANLMNHRGDTPLHIALRRPESVKRSEFGSSEMVVENEAVTPRGTWLTPLAEKSNLELRDQLGFSPLLLAIVNRDQESRDIISKRALKLDSTSMMFDFIAQGNVAKLTSLLTAKPFLVSFRLPDGTTPLHVAAQWGTLGAAQLLIQKGGDVNAKDSRGETPLHEALTRPTGIFLLRSEKMVEFLLGKGANVNALDLMDSSPLHLAIRTGELNLVAALVAKGASLEAHENPGSTPLIQSISGKANIKIVQLLIDKGADVSQYDRGGNTPLLRAVDVRRADLVKVLLDKGADVTGLDAHGRSPLFAVSYPADNATVEIMTMLLAKGADPNEKFYFESILTRLLRRESHRSLAPLKLLLATKKVSLKDLDGNPILFTAIDFRGPKEVVEALIEAGADVNEKDQSGRNLLKQAVLRGTAGVVELLKAKGAKED